MGIGVAVAAGAMAGGDTAGDGACGICTGCVDAGCICGVGAGPVICGQGCCVG